MNICWCFALRILTFSLEVSKFWIKWGVIWTHASLILLVNLKKTYFGDSPILFSILNLLKIPSIIFFCSIYNSWAAFSASILATGSPSPPSFFVISSILTFNLSISSRSLAIEELYWGKYFGLSGEGLNTVEAFLVSSLGYGPKFISLISDSAVCIVFWSAYFSVTTVEESI